MSDSSRPHGLQSIRLLRPWDSPGKRTGVGCHCLLQEIFLTQGSNPGLPHCRQTLHPLSPQGSLTRKAWVKAAHAQLCRKRQPGDRGPDKPFLIHSWVSVHSKGPRTGSPASLVCVKKQKALTHWSTTKTAAVVLRILTATISCFLGSITLTFLSLEAVQIRLPFRFQLTL